MILRKIIDNKNISIKKITIVSFVLLMLITTSLIGFIVFENWRSSSEDIINIMEKEVNNQIVHKVDSFVKVPLHINEINNILIEKGVVNVFNETEREIFFVGVLNTQDDDLYSFGYGTEQGEYYGARRNDKKDIEIMRNNADTNGSSWYYSVTEDMTAGELVVQAGEFDPRTRAWYMAAKKMKMPIFSPVYKHFVMEDLTISAAYPIYDKEGILQGVLGAHIILSKINNYLKEIVEEIDSSAFIIEENSGELVANSIGMDNFTTLEDGNIERLTIKEIGNLAIIEAYLDYKRTGNNSFRIKKNNDFIHINLTEYKNDGLSWMVITAIPESFFTADINKNLKITAFLIILAFITSTTIYMKFTNIFLRPIDNLIETTKRISEGDLSYRAEIIRNDEVGKLSKTINKMADRLAMLVNTLEERVKKRTLELEKMNTILIENKDHLQLILDSTADAIYGIDISGICTFCNVSCLKVLGYKNQDELIGKFMHQFIRYNHQESNGRNTDECSIMYVFKIGNASYLKEELFLRADGTYFNVSCSAHPQYKEGVIIGAVVTFIDITDRKKSEEKIKYLSYHDSLTDLYNRMFFEEELVRLDTERNFPISIIIGDVNGLKLTNDIFGHAAGDMLLKKVAEVFNRVCRTDDIIARMGGDEFAILLPKTEAEQANKIIMRITNEISKEQIIAIKGSISMGSSSKVGVDQNINNVMEDADNKMYIEKTISRKSNNANQIKTIIEKLHIISPREEQHSKNVSEISQSIGKAMNLTEVQIKRLKEAGYLHDIGKIVLDKSKINNEVLSDIEDLLDNEDKEIKQHSVIGYRILNLFDGTLDLADAVLAHHEKWDGSGYPKGLKGEEIPLIARIIAVAEGFDNMTNEFSSVVMSKEKAIQEIKNYAGSKFDPDIVAIFIDMVLHEK